MTWENHYVNTLSLKVIPTLPYPISLKKKKKKTHMLRKKIKGP